MLPAICGEETGEGRGEAGVELVVTSHLTDPERALLVCVCGAG